MPRAARPFAFVPLALLLAGGLGRAAETPPAPPVDEGEDAALFRPPTGAPASLRCEELRRAHSTFQAHLAYRPAPPPPEKLAGAIGDWLDPYGLWAPLDGPVDDTLRGSARALLRELGADGPCAVTEGLGAPLFAAQEKAKAPFVRPAEGSPLPLAEAATVALTAAELPPLARAVASVAAGLGPRRGAAYRASFLAYAFPAVDAPGSASLLRAALLRAWVPLVDGHGSWAPATEASSVYDTDLSDAPMTRLFAQATPVAGGAKVRGGIAPLADDDVLVAVEPQTDPPSPPLYLAGLSPEGLDEVAVALFAPRRVRGVPALWIHDGALVRGVLARPSEPPAPAPAEALPHAFVPLGGEELLVVRVRDVHDEFGADLRALLRVVAGRKPAPAGLVLDLRGNGGGSMDGAVEGLAALLPDVPLFPLTTRHEAAVSVDRTEAPPEDEQWRGPVAALVDADTASAAEMLAGALDAYGRGVLVGTPTFGKGCVQSFEDDGARRERPVTEHDPLAPEDSVGAFRLTTYLYALPDGRAVQRRGLRPTIPYPFAVEGAVEREADNPAAPPTFRGPDVRRRAAIGHPAPFPLGAIRPEELPACEAALAPLGDHPAGTCAALARLPRR